VIYFPIWKPLKRSWSNCTNMWKEISYQLRIFQTVLEYSASPRDCQKLTRTPFGSSQLLQNVFFSKFGDFRQKRNEITVLQNSLFISMGHVPRSMKVETSELQSNDSLQDVIIWGNISLNDNYCYMKTFARECWKHLHLYKASSVMTFLSFPLSLTSSAYSL
jgi:hypothetical protein